MNLKPTANGGSKYRNIKISMLTYEPDVAIYMPHFDYDENYGISIIAQSYH